MAQKAETDEFATSDDPEVVDYEMPLTGASQPRYSTIVEEGDDAPPEPSPRGLRGWVNVKINWLLRRGAYPITPPRRIVHINTPAVSATFCSNKINTAKYSVLTFIPKFLLEQFKKYANLFFLFISLLQQIPGVSPTGRFNTAVPLLIVLSVSAIKEIIEDVARHRANNQVNKRKVLVLRGGLWQQIYWTDVKVGDIVKVCEEEFFPADLLLLSSSEAEGHCYIETSNLDGESNLKIRQSHPKTMAMMHFDQLKCLHGHVECEGPNNQLYKFHGNFKVGDNQLVPIEAEEILLRGARLRNTAHAHGLVIYTGHDSKLLQNATRAPIKQSNVEKMTNKQIIVLAGVLLTLAVISSFGQLIWNQVKGKDHDYLLLPTDTGEVVGGFFLSFLTFIILYNNLIPISLIVTLEVVRFIQAIFIRKDLDMYYAENDTPALARTSNLNEELGQVKHIFSDKTGTLTRNIMQFKRCSIGGNLFLGNDSKSEEFMDDKLCDLLKGGDITVGSFIRNMALCHTVIPELKGGKLEYRASSPDEGALVKAASNLGVMFTSRTPSNLTIEVNGNPEVYEMMNILPFSSDRKRMSVILKTPDGEIKLFIKGADTVIYERLTSSEDNLATATLGHLDALASEGYRTLCFAEATLDPDEYEAWAKLYYEASIAKVDREERIEQTAELIEKNLTLVGATAVEDKLQEGVPQTIAKLQEAGIKVWVLTGDKKQTAINIGLSCNQLTPSTKKLMLTEASLEEVEGKLNTYADTVNNVGTDSNKPALIITGQALEHALSPACSQEFLDVAMNCGAVICCRVTPLQKAQVVQLVKTKVKDSITLAIGDGANDVTMIQAAHVGIGISGLEGLQATLASDYAIAQFRFLIKLLFVHGAWNYRRLTNVIMYSFYKNICLYLMQFWFAFFNGFSGQVLFERWTIGLYNVIFTSLPAFAIGIMDQDVSSTARKSLPKLYRTSQTGREFNAKVLWIWIMVSVFHSLVLFFVIGIAVWHGTPFSDGKVSGLWFTGNTVYTATVITVVLKAGLHMYHWDVFTHISIWASILSWPIFIAVYAQVWPTLPIGSEMVGLDSRLFGSGVFYALIFLVPCIALAPDFLYKIITYQVGKSLLKSVQRQEYSSSKKLSCASEIVPLAHNPGGYSELRNISSSSLESP
ncbi:phospholipid-transporting ATPase IB-like [Dysidea avara]|uniref:phospholipid-transporting ATPase IB-like n=1 Tax=Dysidea avara TaxID=196820 RepID=UPI0033295BAC